MTLASPPALHGGLRSSLRTWLLASRLDLALADGAQPASSRDLAVRAAYLLRARTRAGLAKGLRRAVEDARSTQLQITAAVHVSRRAVRACAPSMLALAVELGGEGVDVRGVAMTRRLLCDGEGPLYCADDPEELRDSIEEIRAAL